MLNGKVILITGGTGSFGQSFVRFVLKNFKPRKIIVFSRDELKQFKMEQELLPRYDEEMRFFLGDIRDLSRLERAFNGVDIVIHAAALKQVPMLEYNPIEAIHTNVIGTQHVINASIDQKVKKIILLSTDKCVYPVNLYGATKLCAEKLFTASNTYALGKSIFSVVRYGNVMGSRGSIIETIDQGSDDAPIKITHKDMTRFWLTLDQCFALVLNSLKGMVGGEIFVPKASSISLMDLCNILAPKRKISFIGIRPGEKMHEALMTDEEARRAFEFKEYYVILPSAVSHRVAGHRKYVKSGKRLPLEFSYTRDTDRVLLSRAQARQFLKKYDSLRPSKYYTA